MQHANPFVSTTLIISQYIGAMLAYSRAIYSIKIMPFWSKTRMPWVLDEIVVLDFFAEDDATVENVFWFQACSRRPNSSNINHFKLFKYSTDDGGDFALGGKVDIWTFFARYDPGERVLNILTSALIWRLHDGLTKLFLTAVRAQYTYFLDVPLFMLYFYTSFKIYRNSSA